MERELKDVVEEIKARVDIVELIGNYTRLKKAGKGWTGLCPFHNDKKPSFNVNPLGFYKCFSCGEGGDIFTFVKKKENLEFIEAVEWLARRAGIVFERKAANPEKASEREEMLRLNEIAVAFFQDRLAKSQDAKDYLARRGILKETQEQWDIGYAPPDWEGLTYHLQQKRANISLAVKIGLLKERQNEGRGQYDTFRNRLMFPIHDVTGRVIAFGGRAMGDDPAKYLNSEQSAIFDKSRTLYGLNFARKRLSGDVSPVFVEGYVDVITTHQAGFTQCVATLGTSMTEDHARMLVRYNPRVIICYDGDAAGIKATLRGASVWEAIGVEGAEVRVARLPAGDDPDSLLQRGETAMFQAALDNAVPRVDFQMELALKHHDLKTTEGRAEAFAEIVPILATIRSLTARGKYADNFAYLHPLHGRYEASRVVQQMMADIESYAHQSNNAQSPRDRGYPLTEKANGGTLNAEPPPPTYRPPSKKQWGEWNPNTQNVIRKGEGGNPSNGGYQGFRKRRDPNAPESDPTPPSLEAPTLTGAEKSERQILRALFSPEWRNFILSRLHPDYLVTQSGRKLFLLIARTPADADGGIDTLLLLRQAESEEDDMPTQDRQTDSHLADDENVPFPAEVPASAFDFHNSAKLSFFIREVLEDSSYLVANECLNETAVCDCIGRLQKHWKDQEQRKLVEILQRPDVTAEQRRALIAQYHEKVRETRGSPPADEG